MTMKEMRVMKKKSEMKKYLDTFLPFLIGVHSSFLPFIKDILIDNSDDNNQVYFKLSI